MMWAHLCRPHKAWLSTEKGKPCNWCDSKPNNGKEWDNLRPIEKQKVDA